MQKLTEQTECVSAMNGHYFWQQEATPQVKLGPELNQICAGVLNLFDLGAQLLLYKVACGPNHPEFMQTFIMFVFNK